MRWLDALPVPGAAAKGACVYECDLIWALEAEKLDLPRLSAQCERYIAMHWEHIHKYTQLIDSLSSPARRRVMMGMFHALQSVSKYSITCQACSGDRCRNVDGTYLSCPDCRGTGKTNVAIKHPSFEDFMSWRTRPEGDF